MKLVEYDKLLVFISQEKNKMCWYAIVGVGCYKQSHWAWCVPRACQSMVRKVDLYFNSLRLSLRNS